VLPYGLIAGGVESVRMFIAMRYREAIGLDRGMIVGDANTVLAFLMVYVGTKTYRDTIGGGCDGGVHGAEQDAAREPRLHVPRSAAGGTPLFPSLGLAPESRAGPGARARLVRP
jgi:hypothetical protein